MKYLFFLLLLFCNSIFADFSGNVIKVIDGDTVDVLTTQHKTIRVRLFGIDAPERGQPYVNKSRQFLASLIAGKNVLIKAQSQDIYHRTLGVIFYQNKNINAKMVANGYAWAYRFKNKATDESLVVLESIAKKNSLGLWSDSNPIAPWDFRKNKNN
ncbi:thermonuclease family protein [Orbus mooreae]|uniref:thermonuclease family protein n=1 Tax=Orbus mooreae TaxID=3074107 RepID=UPI00370D7067